MKNQNITGLGQEVKKRIVKKYIDVCDAIIENSDYHLEPLEKSIDDNEFVASLIVKQSPIVLQKDKCRNSKDETIKKTFEMYNSFKLIAEQEKARKTNILFNLGAAKKLKETLQNIPEDGNESNLLLLFDQTFGAAFSQPGAKQKDLN
jgi:hypothetical protein